MVGEKLVWSDGMSVGVPEVDADHKVLIELIGMIDDAVGAKEADAVLGTVLNALADYVGYHFTREEAMMAAVGYPAEAGHKEMHRDLTAQVMEFQKRFAADARSVDVQELSAFLRGWLNGHIMTEDFGYKPFVEGNPKAREAMASVGLDFFLEEEDDGFL